MTQQVLIGREGNYCLIVCVVVSFVYFKLPNHMCLFMLLNNCNPICTLEIVVCNDLEERREDSCNRSEQQHLLLPRLVTEKFNYFGGAGQSGM